MSTAIHHRHAGSFSGKAQETSYTKAGIWQKVVAYCDAQEERRFFWVALSLLGHGTIFTILTFIVVILTGNVFPLLVATCLNMVLVVIINLAALPLRYLIPVFFTSLLLDLLIMITAFTLWLS